MTTFLWILLGINAFVCAVWLGRHVVLSRAGQVLPPIHDGLYRDQNGPLPAMTMLVAAKDEERNIEGCVRSIAAQDYPSLQIVAINDRSADRTGPILDGIAAGEPRLTAVHVTQLREGWFGKNNAMREGVERASGEWLCFTDADCVLGARRCLTVAMRYALEHRVDFLSVLPNLDNNGFWERVIQPACGGIMMIWFNPLKVNDPSRSAAYANGAFMLMKRSCYDAVGGHESFKTEVNEDVHMAIRAKAIGQRLRVVSNENLYAVRMYNSLKQTWHGWSRIFYGCFGNYRRLVLSALVVVIFTLTPWLTAAATGVAVAAGAGTPLVRGLLYTAMAAGAAQLSVMVRFYRLSHSSPLYGLLYPIGAAIGLGALVNAMRRLRGRGTTNWRGTVYRGNKVETGPTAK